MGCFPYLGFGNWYFFALVYFGLKTVWKNGFCLVNKNHTLWTASDKKGEKSNMLLTIFLKIDGTSKGCNFNEQQMQVPGIQTNNTEVYIMCASGLFWLH